MSTEVIEANSSCINEDPLIYDCVIDSDIYKYFTSCDAIQSSPTFILAGRRYPKLSSMYPLFPIRWHYSPVSILKRWVEKYRAIDRIIIKIIFAFS